MLLHERQINTRSLVLTASFHEFWPDRLCEHDQVRVKSRGIFTTLDSKSASCGDNDINPWHTLIQISNNELQFSCNFNNQLQLPLAPILRSIHSFISKCEFSSISLWFYGFSSPVNGWRYNTAPVHADRRWRWRLNWQLVQSEGFLWQDSSSPRCSCEGWTAAPGQTQPELDVETETKEVNILMLHVKYDPKYGKPEHFVCTVL